MPSRDGDWRLIDHDERLGHTFWAMFDGRQTHIRTDYRVSDIVKANKATRNAQPSGWKGENHLVGSVPLNIYHASGLSEAIQQKDTRFIDRFLKENSAWKTKDGTL